jgi:5-bromo-4-chloroindolyl phosphate hydrolysis protein
MFKTAASVLEHYESNLPRWKKELENLRSLVKFEEKTKSYKLASNTHSHVKH